MTASNLNLNLHSGTPLFRGPLPLSRGCPLNRGSTFGHWSPVSINLGTSASRAADREPLITIITRYDGVIVLSKGNISTPIQTVGPPIQLTDATCGMALIYSFLFKIPQIISFVSLVTSLEFPLYAILKGTVLITIYSSSNQISICLIKITADVHMDCFS